MHIVTIVIGVIVALNLLGMAVHAVLSRGELEAITPYGQLVEVTGGKMHVYSLGAGEETIVLLPGWGVPLPSADFGPLMRKLSEKYTVVCVEYFGVGFSEKSEVPRTSANHTEELREALLKAGFQPPYVLMPHSASGIYSEYYATMFPEEVSAIVMLDTTSTAHVEKVPSIVRVLYSLGKFQQSTGLTRLTMRLLPDTHVEEHGYTPQEKADYRKFLLHTLNDTVIDQAIRLMDSVVELKDMPFPDSIPVLKLISRETVATLSKKDAEAGMAYQLAHVSRLGEGAKYEMMDGSHFLYQTKADEIVRLTEEFIDGSGVR